MPLVGFARWTTAGFLAVCSGGTVLVIALAIVLWRC
jgi:hypothetical protein